MESKNVSNKTIYMPANQELSALFVWAGWQKHLKLIPKNLQVHLQLS
jgi:hypothetical protein